MVVAWGWGEQVEVDLGGGADNACDESLLERTRNGCDTCTWWYYYMTSGEAEVGASLKGKTRDTDGSLEKLHQNPVCWHHS